MFPHVAPQRQGEQLRCVRAGGETAGVAEQLPQSELAAQVAELGQVLVQGASSSRSPSATKIIASVAVQAFVIDPWERRSPG